MMDFQAAENSGRAAACRPVVGERGEREAPPPMPPAGRVAERRRAAREMAKCLAISLGFHLAVLAAIPLLASMIQLRRPCPLVIDFTVETCPPAEPRRTEAKPSAAPVRRVAVPAPAAVTPKRPVAPVRQPERPAQTEPAALPATPPPQATPAPRDAGKGGETRPATTATAGTGQATASAHQPPAASGGGDSGSAESAKQRYLREHFSYIRELVAKRIVYPAIARKMGWGGKAVVAFTVMEDGTADSIRLVQSSGVPILDRSALETVRRAAPFPRPPVRAEIVIPVLFKLL